MSASATPAFELRDVHKHFGAVHALRGVSLTVAPGEVIGLVGENGAGKSTLAAIASGLVSPDAGSMLVAGQEVTFAGPADAQAAGIRIVPQELVLCDNLTVAENIFLGQFPTSSAGVLRKQQLNRDARGRLEQLGLGDLDPRRPAARLSVVDKTFVQIARAMTPGTSVLFVDEPTAPMSDSEVDRVLDTIRAVTRAGIAIVYVSHRLDEVFQIADRVVVLRDGARVAEYDARQLSREQLVEAMVGGRDLHVAERSAVRGAPRLSLRGLSAGTVEAASLDVHAGEIVAVYGIAGSGREELGAAIVGAIARRAGEVHVAGADVPPSQVRLALEAGIGYVPAERRTQGLLLDAPVRDNITLGALASLARGGVLLRRWERALARTWIDQLTIAAPSPDTIVRKLSGGSQQKVLLARWLAAGRRILVLEEPTRGVDIATKAEIYRLLRSLVDDGAAILVVSSDVEEVALVGDRVLVMREGRVAAELEGAREAEIVHAAITMEEVGVGIGE